MLKARSIYSKSKFRRDSRERISCENVKIHCHNDKLSGKEIICSKIDKFKTAFHFYTLMRV
jgi:hypothetical protein